MQVETVFSGFHLFYNTTYPTQNAYNHITQQGNDKFGKIIL